ncbi:hypothetical protein Tco_0261300 [Tanacetum coccineum]
MHPIDPPSSDYVSGPEEPEQAPLSSDYVSRPKYPEYLAPFDEEVYVDSPMALSPGYIANFDPEEDPKDESEDGLMDYPTDGRDDDEDDDDDDSSRDDGDDEDEEEASDEDKEEEHLAHADSTTAASLVVDLVPSAEETKPFETDESAVDRLLAIPTPPPSPFTPLSSPLPHIALLPLHVPSPLATSPTYAEAPLGLREAEIRLRTASPLPSPTSPPTHHPLPSPLLPPLVDRKSSAAAAAKHPGLGAARTLPTWTRPEFPERHGHRLWAAAWQFTMSFKYIELTLRYRKMASKRGTKTKTTLATATATTTTTTLMTDATIRELIAQGVANALAGRPI